MVTLLGVQVAATTKSLVAHGIGFRSLLPEPIPLNSMDVIMTKRSVSGAPNGSPVTVQTMLEFAARHGISPQTKHFPMDRVNEALAHLEAGKARYRIVLDA